MTAILKQPLIKLASLFIFLLAALPLAANAGSVAAGDGWDNVGQRTSGSWRIVEDSGAYYIELGDNFKTRKAPDLKIYLSTAEASSLNNKNGLEEAVFIGKLTTHKGQQRYQLPANISPEMFSSIVIYCEAFSKFWAAASLS